MHPPPQDPCILRLLARSLPLASPGSPLWFLKVGIVSLQIGLQIGETSLLQSMGLVLSFPEKSRRLIAARSFDHKFRRQK